MAPVGYQEGSEPSWWWKVAMHIDQAQLALVHAMAYNVDDPRTGTALHGRLCEGQAILLAIFRAKGLIPKTDPTSAPSAPMPPMSVAPPSGPMQFPPMQFAPSALQPVPPATPSPIMSEPAVPAELIERAFGDLTEAPNGHPAGDPEAPTSTDVPESVAAAGEAVTHDLAEAEAPIEAPTPSNTEVPTDGALAEAPDPAAGMPLPMSTEQSERVDGKSAE